MNNNKPPGNNNSPMNNNKTNNTPIKTNAPIKTNTPVKTNNNNSNNNSNNSNNNSNNIVKKEPKGPDFADNLSAMLLSSQTSRIVFVTMIFLTIFFGLLGFLYHNSVTRKVQTLVSKNVALFNKTEKLITASDINPSFNLKESYILYMTFDNSHGNHIWFTSFAESKIILRRLDDNFMIKYNPKHNHLIIDIRIKKLDIKSDTETELTLDLHDSYEKIIVPNIPHQQWLQIAIIIDNRLVDVYLNKKLAVSRVLENVPILSNESIMLGEALHNPNAYVGRFEYANDIISTTDLKALHFKNMRYLSVDGVLRDTVNINGHETIDQLYAPEPSS